MNIILKKEKGKFVPLDDDEFRKALKIKEGEYVVATRTPCRECKHHIDFYAYEKGCYFYRTTFF